MIVVPWPERMGVEVGTMVRIEAAFPHMKAEILELRAALKSFTNKPVKCYWTENGGDGIYDPRFCHGHQVQFYGDVCPNKEVK